MKHRNRFKMKFLMLIMFIFPLAVSAKTYGELQELSLSSEGISAMKIECGAGFLKLRGVEGLNEIRVKADVVAGSKKGEKLKKFIEENVELSLEKHMNKAVLISRIERSSFPFFHFSFNKESKRIDLTVEVPRKMDVEIDDGSGAIELENIKGEVDIDDGSGSLNVTDVKGELEIHDTSGTIEISNIEGKTDIHDGSSSIVINNVKGELDIRDGSGSIDVKDVTGDITIYDGSGQIKVCKVKGDVKIEDGSSSLWTTDIDGNVKIYDGSGSIYIDGVSKDVDIAEAGSGGVQFKDIKGKISGDL